MIGTKPVSISKFSAKPAKEEKLDKGALDTLEDILHGSSIDEAKHDIHDLKEKVDEHVEDLMALGTLAHGELGESKIARRLRYRVNSMISGVDTLVAKLEVERKKIKEEVKELGEAMEGEGKS